jgi:hypothetical protein
MGWMLGMMVLVEMLQEALGDSMILILIMLMPFLRRRLDLCVFVLLRMWWEVMLVDELLVFSLLFGFGMPIR